MPVSTRKLATPKSQSKLTDAFRAGGTRITKPSVSSSLKPSTKTEPVSRTNSVTVIDVKDDVEKQSSREPVVAEIKLKEPVEKNLDISKPEKRTQEVLEEVLLKKVENEQAEEVDDEEEKEEEEVVQEAEVVKRAVALPVEVPKDQEDLAMKTTDKQIKKYLDDIHSANLAASVHQDSLSIDEKILRHFDLSSQYGPCIGITRFRRWNRAYRLGLKPPVEVLAVLIRTELGEGLQTKTQLNVVKHKEDVGALAYINDLTVT